MTREQGILTHEEVWRRYDAIERRLTAPVSERMLELAGIGPGMRVLDLATGRGEPAIRAAKRVGPAGAVVGVELSAPLLEMAREQAAIEGVTNLELRVGDAERLDDLPSGHFHAVTCRWGLMYMTSPIAALAGARRALVPGGVLVAGLWAEPERVPYFTLPRRLLARYRPVPEPGDDVPSTFRYADPDRIARDFGAAGFAVEHTEELEIPVIEAEASADVLAWVRAFGLTRLLADLPEAAQRAWEADLTRELELARTGAVIRLGGVTRIVLARATP